MEIGNNYCEKSTASRSSVRRAVRHSGVMDQRPKGRTLERSSDKNPGK